MMASKGKKVQRVPVTDLPSDVQVDKSRLKFIDIAVNLTDPVFRGIHRGKRKHEDDFDSVLERAKLAGVETQIITGGSLSESKEAIKLAKDKGLYATIGCHPTRSSEFEEFEDGPEAYLNALDELISENLSGKGKVVAVGECGLDYDRLSFASEEVQKRYFKLQLSLAKKYHLPLFLHSRAAHSDFVSILREEGFGTNGGSEVGGKGGVVHSFTGKLSEMNELIEMGFYIGVNGCSLKTEENLEVARAIPLERLMLETDAPWCSMTSTHASKRHLDSLPAVLQERYLPPATKPEKYERGRAVKGRNEPCAIGGISWIVHQLHLENGYSSSTIESVAEMVYKNTIELFSLGEVLN